MTDDQGWGQMGYYDHPVLKTPNLNAMAANGLRFDRFYAGAPVCSPARATVLTGRSNDRTGVLDHGYPMHRQEKTIAQAFKQAGYATGHFGKWHLNGIKGPGVPILKTDSYHPGIFGFSDWLSVTNFFDLNPIMSRNGRFEEFKGDSSEIIVNEAVKFIGANAKVKQPFLAVIWYATPHRPFMALPGDKIGPQSSAHHHGELVAMDRSIGTLRKALREFGVSDNTLLWFNSDNGGLPRIKPSSVGGLRGYKGSLLEGGVRVPGIIEWPRGIANPRITKYPASTMDIFPTLVDVAGLPKSALQQPQDGISLYPLFSKEIGARKQPIPFQYNRRGALVDNQWKLITDKVGSQKFLLYDLEADKRETADVAAANPEVFNRLIKTFEAFHKSVESSAAGKDYPQENPEVKYPKPSPRFWTEMEVYTPYFEKWQKRPEYSKWLK